MAREHPDLFEAAKKYEKSDPQTGNRYTWVQGMTLDELAQNAEEILERAAQRRSRNADNRSWQEILKDVEDDDPENQACLICSL